MEDSIFKSFKRHKLIGDSHVENLWNEENPDLQVEMICSWLGIQYYEENARSKIYVDFLFHALHFVKEAEFSLEKMVTLFSVLQYIFEAATGYSGSTSMSSQVMFTPKMEDNFGLLKKLILMHSVDSPPASAVFNIDDVQVITDFMTRTFYRHYKAYVYAFEEKQECEREVLNVSVETPLTPMALSDAVSSENIMINSTPSSDPEPTSEPPLTENAE